MKQRLVAAALSLFAARGYDAVSVSDITDAAGVTPGTLYVHFENKRALYQETIRIAGPHVILEQLQNVDRTLLDQPVRFVKTIATGVVHNWSSERSRTFMTLFTRDMLEASSSPQMVFEGIDAVIRTLSPHVSRWRKTGQLASTAAPEQIIWELFAPLVYIRFAYWQASASEDAVAAGIKLAQRHIDYFIKTTFMT